MTVKSDLAIVGTVGVPACYGGFETLVEYMLPIPISTTVYCSSKHYSARLASYKGANLVYLPLDANGVMSIPYDMWSLLHAGFKGHKSALVLGVSGTIILPLIRLLFPGMKLVVNVDGLEWKRDKWNGLGKFYLKFSEKVAVKFAHQIVTDNQGLADYIFDEYAAESTVIAYGGDHAFDSTVPLSSNGYAFALCRIEPENNVHLILETFSQIEKPITFIGNWNNSEYGRKLRKTYEGYENITLLDPVYELDKLAVLRAGCDVYIHGHSAGGTNPSLVEMMHFGKPIIAFDCVFNRYTMENLGWYFADTESLKAALDEVLVTDVPDIKALAEKRYTWGAVREQYLQLM